MWIFSSNSYDSLVSFYCLYLTKRSIPLKIARPFFLIRYLRFHREFLTSNKTELVCDAIYTGKISSRLLTSPPSCLSLQEYHLSASSRFLIAPLNASHFKGTVCLPPLASKLPLTSRVLSVCLLTPPHCTSKLPLTSKVLSVCLLAVSQPLLCHFNSMSHHLEGAICMCPVQRHVISESAPLSLITPHTSLLSPLCSLLSPSSGVSIT